VKSSDRIAAAEEDPRSIHSIVIIDRAAVARSQIRARDPGCKMRAACAMHALRSGLTHVRRDEDGTETRVASVRHRNVEVPKWQ
jgi:hypothetical protein